MIKLNKNSKGFTIIELMIATSVFSVILLIATFGLIQVGRMFYKGITQSKTQEVARNVMEEIAQNIQFSGDSVSEIVTDAEGVSKLCIGDQRYSFIKGAMLSDTPDTGQYKNILVVDQKASCAIAPPQKIYDPSERLSSDSIELLQPKMRLSELTVVEAPPAGSGLYTIRIRIVAGEDDLIENPDQPDAICKSIQLGSQFCAWAELNTTVLKRVNVKN